MTCIMISLVAASMTSDASSVGCRVDSNAGGSFTATYQPG